MDDFFKMEPTKSHSGTSMATVSPLLISQPRTVKSVSAKAFDTFRAGPERMIAQTITKDGRRYDAKAAAFNTANTPLVRRLKGRHLQMIAIGGSIGMSRYPVLLLKKGITLLLTALRHGFIHRFRSRPRDWWARLSSHCLYTDRRGVVLYCSSAGRDGSDLSCSWVLLNLCHTVHRSSMGICLWLELRYAMAIHLSTRDHGRCDYAGILES